MSEIQSLKHQLPKGYVILPKGDRYLSLHCRKQSLELGKDIYIITDRKGVRQGLGVPHHVLKEVEALAKATAQSRLDAVIQKDRRLITTARLMVEKLYPKMPADEVQTCLNHAFHKGSGRVGRSTTLRGDSSEKLKFKVCLAVAAYIRHEHTLYDSLLCHGILREEARQQVEGDMNEVLLRWRSESKEPTVERKVKSAAKTIQKPKALTTRPRIRPKSKPNLRRNRKL
ncbi:hypothetical protein P152DRAFT_247990 [Eremomyces bilateralis CBS 781.70]|uniref:DUF2293 domain-containing protein n=1 Tax=Eremomyces bilateralis CBS 781.70 TaxID=1392243 RepID=A0A6G1GAX1_9PEZI|nr:uncharacterized protein P152DRAFT_247990 [Eremomyces bilateralis CBS 781.70]KAF1815174.1 hypothetical protein P152DRAFT_247990 [Eremomyces bilateralis CBS 781.70]